MNGRMVIATAGHDVGEIYVVVGAQQGYLLLADGVRKTLNHPKRKNPGHIRFLTQEPGVKLIQRIEDRTADDAIRRAVQQYRKSNRQY